MPNGNPRDGFFYPTLTLMIDSYIPYLLFDGTSNVTKDGMIWAVTCYFQQCGILTSVYSDELVQPPVKLNNSKWRLVSRLTVIECWSDLQWLWADCAYAQADLKLCWSYIPHCWKSHVAAHFTYVTKDGMILFYFFCKPNWQRKTQLFVCGIHWWLSNWAFSEEMVHSGLPDPFEQFEILSTFQTSNNFLETRHVGAIKDGNIA